jgi:hypothetical protein
VEHSEMTNKIPSTYPFKIVQQNYTQTRNGLYINQVVRRKLKLSRFTWRLCQVGLLEMMLHVHVMKFMNNISMRFISKNIDLQTSGMFANFM